MTRCACCTRDEGFVALRRRPAGGGVKPPLKRRESGTASEPGPQCRSREEPGGLPVLLARRCPACRWREPGLRLACGTWGRRALTLRRARWRGREGACQAAETARR